MVPAERIAATAGRPMKAVFKGAALFVAVACLVWIAVLWRWRATQRDMDSGDIVLYLGVLPVTVFALALAVRWAVRGALVKQDAKATGAAASSGMPNGNAASASADTVSVTWHLLSAFVRLPSGETVDELLAATLAGTPRPRPDPALRDDEGLPVMTARIEGVDTEAVDSDLQRHATDGRGATTDSHAGAEAPPPRAVRALAILSPLIDELVQSLDTWSLQWADAIASGTEPLRGSGSTLATPAPSAGADKVVRVLAAWPVDWDDITCSTAQAWLTERLCEPLASALPTARWSVRAQRMSGTDLLAAAERTLDALQQQGRDDPVVLLACHSDLDDAGIRALEDQQRLFHSTRRPKVALAGEGAAVLVFSAMAWPADAAIEPERVRLKSPALTRRSQSIESPGRTASDDTVALARLALTRAGLGGAELARLASDADQHTARATELFAVTLALMPELDANEDFRLTGTLAGRLEAVAPLLTLACAAAQARESGKPTLALSLADRHWRMAAVLSPQSFSSAAVPAPA